MLVIAHSLAPSINSFFDYGSLRSKISNKVEEDKAQMAETGVEMMMESKT
ncbi:MAG: hypothetical protein NVV82_21045 [Sporocytophaga sp.]|nr:hypothetical protein [Sporocytophaga sp.]